MTESAILHLRVTTLGVESTECHQCNRQTPCSRSGNHTSKIILPGTYFDSNSSKPPSLSLVRGPGTVRRFGGDRQSPGRESLSLERLWSPIHVLSVRTARLLPASPGSRGSMVELWFVTRSPKILDEQPAKRGTYDRHPVIPSGPTETSG